MELLIASVIFLTIGYVMGFYVRDLWDKVQYYKQQQPKPNNADSPQSSILEPPLSPAEIVQREQEELLERINRPS